MKEKKVDKFLLITFFLLLIVGLFMFFSSSLGILARKESAFYAVIISQLALGLPLGLLGFYFALKVNFKFWKKYSFYIFLGSILLTLAVFIPFLGVDHQGARRWIDIGPVSFQPVEFLKFGFIIYFSAWLSWAKTRAKDFRFGILPFFIMLAVIALVLFNQPDTKSFILIFVTGVGMLFLSEVPFKYIFITGLVGLVTLASLVMYVPYLQSRVKTFIDPANDPRGSGYQIQQSMIAIGSGGLFGRGYGQSVQKFNYLPEPQGDSIFAIIGEELGFIGASGVVLLYLLFAMRGMKVAKLAPDSFGRLLAGGIVIMITAQSFLNIASITGVFPLTGVPLVFMSHGGTSLMIYMVAVGIVLNISKFQKKNI
ncbi:MAG: putative lipid II flippase FtsW [Candidatus Pacebacteria bacterium]|nr:putative lipid II flippase FtsW [Candidatus Paceibacterota bacterium]MCF7863148.1 putative lipid II flippase FtsW [Candidatus Paceibacterota bacterium]